jgi:hypothetical protein
VQCLCILADMNCTAQATLLLFLQFMNYFLIWLEICLTDGIRNQHLKPSVYYRYQELQVIFVLYFTSASENVSKNSMGYQFLGMFVLHPLSYIPLSL